MSKVTIIIPVYNSAEYIGKCIESILNQTYHDYDILIVNDGSKDNSQQIINEYKEKYPNKTVWCWTGFLFDRDLKEKEVLNYIDVLVDGQYKDELHDFRLKWCGSSNQRVIDVKKSLKKGDVVLLDERKLVGA